ETLRKERPATINPRIGHGQTAEGTHYAGTLLHALPLLAFILLLSIPVTQAAVDLGLPQEGARLQEKPISFTYYVSLPNAEHCTLDVSGTLLTETAITQGLNTLTLTELADGNHSWNVTCMAPNQTQQSSTQQFTLDSTAPTVTLLAPTGTITNPLARFTTSETGSCTLIANNAPLEENIPASPNVPIERSLASLGYGAHTWTASCTDLHGNTAEPSPRSFTYQPDYSSHPFTIELNKETYQLGETPQLTLVAPPGSTVRIDVCPDQNGFVQCKPTKTSTGTGSPQTIALHPADQPGSYFVEALMNITNTTKLATETYSAQSNLALGIEHDGEELTGESITLSADVQGASGTATITWKLPDGTTKIGTSIETSFSSPGEKKITATATDSAAATTTKDLILNIKQAYVLTVTVKDKDTGALLQDASVQIDGQTKDTGTNGQATLRIQTGTHTLTVLRGGYAYARQDVPLTQDKALTITLTRTASPPRSPSAHLRSKAPIPRHLQQSSQQKEPIH
ncbi:MAG: carboxypeptidase regulatory-like domain-containing protein, partial [Nitrosarchaeum sp.]|nr:carboxypeptidase regulatory-like domain-containing protein [Nitrosarchaeum sp.]